LVVPSNRDFGRSFRSRLLNEQIQYTDDRVTFVRSRRVREKNLFSNTGDATDLIEWHMPLVPATIVKRNAVMWNSREQSWILFLSPPSLIQQTIGVCGAGFLSAFIMARRAGIEPASPEGETPSALPAKLTARVRARDEFLVSTTATTLDAPGAYSRGRE
jgi:hypothetical protein